MLPNSAMESTAACYRSFEALKGGPLPPPPGTSCPGTWAATLAKERTNYNRTAAPDPRDKRNAARSLNACISGLLAQSAQKPIIKRGVYICFLFSPARVKLSYPGLFLVACTRPVEDALEEEGIQIQWRSQLASFCSHGRAIPVAQALVTNLIP